MIYSSCDETRTYERLLQDKPHKYPLALGWRAGNLTHVLPKDICTIEICLQPKIAHSPNDTVRAGVEPAQLMTGAYNISCYSVCNHQNFLP